MSDTDREQQFIKIELTFEKEKNVHMHEIHSKSTLVQPCFGTSTLKCTNRFDNDAR